MVSFTICMSESRLESTFLKVYINEIISTNEQRALVLIYNNLSIFQEFVTNFYALKLPLYNIYLPQLNKFNGKYGGKYDIRVTYEESKLHFVFLNKLKHLYTDLSVIRKIYFWRDRDKIIVFIKEKYEEKKSKAGFKFCFQFYITNIVFTYLGNGIKSYIYNPFNNTILISKPQNFFENKFLNLYGYNLKISMFPSVVNIYDNNTYHGRDGLMSRAIAHHLNATYTYLHPRITSLAPVLNQYDDIAERVAEVGFNTRYIKFNFKNLIEKTYPHDRDDLTCLIPKKNLQEFLGFTSLLTETVWVLSLAASLFFFIYVVISLVLAKRRLDVINVVMMILLLLFNKPVKERRNFNFRLALISYLTFCAFLNTLIVCRLTSIVTAPKNRKEIETIKELADTTYPIVTIDRFQELLNASIVSTLREKILPRLKIIKEEQYLDEISKCKNVVFICKDHLASYAQIQNENFPNGIQFYQVMKERILPALSCYIVSYGSPFLSRFDSLIQRLVQSGIHDYWKKKTWNKLEIHKKAQTNNDDYSDTHSVAKASLNIASKILFYGFGISTIVFLIEIMSTIKIILLCNSLNKF